MSDESATGRSTVEAMMAADEASRSLGIELVEYGEGNAVARMRVREDMVNGHDIAHGGIVFTLADTAFACACNSWGPVTIAAAAEIVFVAPARLGDELVAEATVRTRFGRTGIYDITIRRHADADTGTDDIDTDTAADAVVAEFRGRSQERR